METRRILCLPVCAAAFLWAALDAEPVSAQVVYYGNPVVIVPQVYVPPQPNLLYYSPTFIGWRSAGYFGGNGVPYYTNAYYAGPYYSGPIVVSGTISGSMVMPPLMQPYPGPGWAYPW
jgi:hypothetical protein